MIMSQAEMCKATIEHRHIRDLGWTPAYIRTGVLCGCGWGGGGVYIERLAACAVEREIASGKLDGIAGCAHGGRERRANAVRVLLLLGLQVGLEIAAFGVVDDPRNAILANDDEKGAGRAGRGGSVRWRQWGQWGGARLAIQGRGEQKRLIPQVGKRTPRSPTPTQQVHKTCHEKTAMGVCFTRLL